LLARLTPSAPAGRKLQRPVAQIPLVELSHLLAATRIPSAETRRRLAAPIHSVAMLPRRAATKSLHPAAKIPLVVSLLRQPAAAPQLVRNHQPPTIRSAEQKAARLRPRLAAIHLAALKARRHQRPAVIHSAAPPQLAAHPQLSQRLVLRELDRPAALVQSAA
jgi:hypothetical protein